MNDAESTTGPDPDLWGDAQRLSYAPSETASIHRSLVRLKAFDDLEEASSEQFLSRPRPVQLWLKCDPEGRMLADVFDQRILTQEEFQRRMQPVTKLGEGAYPTLELLHTRMLGGGELRTPQLGAPIGHEGYWSIADWSIHEIYETLFLVFECNASVTAAALVALNGQYGYGKACRDASEYDERLAALIYQVESYQDEEGINANDIPYVRAVWRRELRTRLLNFSRFEALGSALRLFEHLERFGPQAIASQNNTRKGVVTLTEADHALLTLRVLRRARYPINSYADAGREIEMSGELDDRGIEGTSVVKAVERALKKLGETPRPETLVDLLSHHEGYFHGLVEHTSKVDGK